MNSAASGFEAQWIDVHAHFMVPQTGDELKRSAIARCERCFLASEHYRWTEPEKVARRVGRLVAAPAIRDRERRFPAPENKFTNITETIAMDANTMQSAADLSNWRQSPQ